MSKAAYALKPLGFPPMGHRAPSLILVAHDASFREGAQKGAQSLAGQRRGTCNCLKINGAPCRTRTCDLLVRSLTRV